MKNFIKDLSFAAVIIMVAGCASNGTSEVSEGSEKKTEKTAEAEEINDEGLYAVITVSKDKEEMGKIKLKLFPDKTPKTVKNFTGLATGEREFIDPKTGEKKKERFYDGIIFHRVIEGFMIQTGDPTGTGRGGPGYKFEDEFVKDLKFDREGILAMANSGPDTNGSQFFITLAPAPWLNNRHTIFGEVVEGMDVVKEIGSVKTGNADRPVEKVVMDKVKIVENK
ncbi:MAG: peptidylprolyl isomerase [Elusimicrobiota bacterium]